MKVDTCETAIIGGGVSGLRLARLLSDGSERVVVLEASPKVGGRCQTVCTASGKCHDSGALRVHASHTHALGVLKSHGLTLVSMPPGEHVVRANGEGDLLDIYARDGMPEGLGASLPLEGAKGRHAMMHAWDRLGPGGTRALQDASGYDDLPVMAATEFASSHDHTREGDQGDGSGFSTIKEGWQELLRRMAAGLDVRTDHQVIHAQRESEGGYRLVFRQGHTPLLAKRLVLAVPPDAAMRVGGLGPELASRACLHAMTPFPLLRVFAHFDRPHGVKGHLFVATGAVRQIQEIDERLLMINYCGGRTAEAWNDGQLSDRTHAETLLLREARRCVPGLPKPASIHWHHWPRGVHIWRPGTDAQAMAALATRPLWPADGSVYMTGEALSPNFHAWVEGALRAAGATYQAMKQEWALPKSLPAISKLQRDQVVVGGLVIDFARINWLRLHPGGKEALDAHPKEDVTHMFLGQAAFHSLASLNHVFRGTVGVWVPLKQQ